MSETDIKENQNEDKSDNFSDVDDNDNSFEVKLNFVKNSTTTSNFKFDINIVKQGAVPSTSQKKEESVKEEQRTAQMSQINEIKNENSTTIVQKSIEPNEGSSGSDYENENSSGMQQIEKNDKVISDGENIYEFYQKLRDKFNETGELYEDPDFPCDPSLFCTEKENPEGEFEIEFERPPVDEDNLEFFAVETHASPNYNIEHEFKISRGILNDKFFIGALLMLFQKREEFFTNLVIDFEHANENIKAGFCGFTFFINGEWKNVTVDTRIPAHQRGEYSLSKSLTPKSPFWVSLFEKAYAKIFGSYSVLNLPLLKDFLVDFTGGWSKMIKVPKDNIEDKHKKFYFDEITRCVAQGYLIGCMKYEESKMVDELNESISDKDQPEDEQILPNTIYTIVDIQEYENLKLIFLVNHWDKGKFTHPYGPEDETWEANKKLTERLNYTVSTTDGTFWMLFDEFITSFNTLYYCRIFPDSWSQYTIPGEWKGITAGGSPQKKFPWVPEQKFTIGTKGSVIGKKASVYMDPKLASGKNISGDITSPIKNTLTKRKSNVSGSNINMVSQKQTSALKEGLGSNKELKDQSSVNAENSIAKKQSNIIVCDFKREIINDTDDCFFLNPQYKLEIKQGTKLIISLMQEDQKMANNAYIKCNFMIVLTKGRHSRVWDVKQSNIIKTALDEKDDGIRREIVMILDYNEIIRRYNNKNSKKLSKSDKVQVNLIPYMEFTTKYEIDRKGNQRFFHPYHPEAKYWLRIFASDDIYIAELKKPFETTIGGSWLKEVTSGGPRFLIHKNKYVENPYWSINPQYLLKFNGNVRTKIILRKQGGHFANEETNVGIMITKPKFFEDDKNHLLEAKNKAHQGIEKETVKLEPIQRVIKSTNKILKTKNVKFEEIFPKLSINYSEQVIESSYNNNYCASIQKTFSKLDSPVILIPTLNARDSSFDYELKIYSTKPTEIYSLYNDSCSTLIGEWNEHNAGGSHLAIEEKDIKSDDQYKRQLTWMDNPKFLLQFDSKDWIKNLEFEVIVSRSESIWKRRLSMSMINAMMSCYIFKYERDKWKENCVNLPEIDFMPKNEVIVSHTEQKADPKGYILMPITYAKDVYGPFSIMVKCNEKFKLSVFKEK